MKICFDLSSKQMDILTVQNAQIVDQLVSTYFTTVYKLQTKHVMKCRYRCESFNSMIKVIKHPNLCPIVDHGIVRLEDSKKYGCIHPQYEKTLQDVELKLDQKYKILSQIFDAIYHLHLNNLIHLDIKPSNIMLDENFKPIIIDFDTMILCNSTIKSFPRTTPLYMPNFCNKVSPMNDVYAFGLVAYELLSCLSIHKLAKNHQIVDVSNLDYSLILDEDWRRIIKKCLDYNKDLSIYSEIIQVVSNYHTLIACKQQIDNEVEIIDANKAKQFLCEIKPNYEVPFYLVVRGSMLSCLTNLDIHTVSNIVLTDYTDSYVDPEITTEFNIKFGHVFTPICTTKEQCIEVVKDLQSKNVKKWFKNYDPWNCSLDEALVYGDAIELM